MRMVGKYAYLVLAFIALSSRLPALPARSEGQLEFWVDGSAFASREGNAWQEIYWSFSPLGLKAKDSLGQGLARFQTTVRLADSTDHAVLSEQWTTTAPMPDTATIRRRSMIWLDQIEGRNLAPGSYTLSLTIDDLVGGQQGRIKTVLTVPGFPAGAIAMSQIELASEIAIDSTSAKFRKGDLRIRPKPDRTFGTRTLEQLCYYVEVYGLPQDLAPARSLLFMVGYSRAGDETLHVLSIERLQGRGGSATRYGTIGLADLSPGYYRLQLQVTDTACAVLASAQANFKVERDMMEIPPEQRALLEEQMAMEREGGEYYDKIEYLLNEKDLAFFQNLSPAGKREFLRRFWKRQGQNPDTKENEALREHVRRYQYADNRFRELNSPGSASDRGRIYIRNGPPNEIETKTMDQYSRDLVIWRYPDGNVYMFYDERNVGSFKLIYDRLHPENNDPKYKSIIKEAEQSGENKS